MTPKPPTIAQDDLLKEILSGLLDEPSALMGDLSRKRDEEVADALSIVNARQACEDYQGPTPERAVIANGALQKFDLEDRTSRGTVGIVFRVASPVRKMAMLGQITQSQADAAEKFHTSYAIATQQARTTSRYGDEMAMASAVGTGGGTPLNQLTGEAAKRLSHQEMRVNHANYYRNACAALGDDRASTWLTAFLNEDGMPGSDKPISLEDVGRNFMAYESAKSCQTAGSTLVRWWLKILCNHYGFKD